MTNFSTDLKSLKLKKETEIRVALYNAKEFAHISDYYRKYSDYNFVEMIKEKFRLIFVAIKNHTDFDFVSTLSSQLK